MTTETGYTLRPATDDDIPAVLKIEATSFPYPWSEENFRSELAKPYCTFLVMTDDETDSVLAGYIVFWLIFDECRILTLAVDPSHRRKGFAKEMIRHAISAAIRKGVSKLLLEVRKSNQSAIQLYQSVGFVIIHVRKNYYEDGEEAYQMALYVNESTVF